VKAAAANVIVQLPPSAAINGVGLGSTFIKIGNNIMTGGNASSTGKTSKNPS
jgi:hypothetical protein